MTDMKQTVSDPVTKENFIQALKSLGITGNQILEVHTQMSAFGYVVGGARTIVDGLMELCADGGTILMPSQVSDNSEPADWEYPAIEPTLYKEVRNAIPAYDPNYSDVHYMGSVVENFRLREGVVTSNHPRYSYCAWGRYARLLCNHQSMHFPLADESPTARLYELKGYVLLIGCDFDSTTCMHLAEYRSDCRPIGIEGAKVQTPDGEVWRKYLNLQLDSDIFNKVGEIMKKKNMVRETMLGGCKITLFSAASAIDEAVRYFDKTMVYDLYR
ncbi:MAG: AAC(3) family N-acetyltransferase [Erysipelotrichaceae bacterium]|nr:AAC(3) family N-acetyltransferase [Erysipelotrichaceae bacterium]MDY6035126.1 AAC(3) family N-acetyltransferase [Bulleidia sp.]